MSAGDDVNELRREFGRTKVVEDHEFRGERTIEVRLEALREILKYCRRRLGYELLLDVSSVDNAGEEPFDLPLVRLLGEYAPVTYVVKESPVQDDITLEDLEKFGVVGELPRVMSTGTDTPGVDMDMASDEFKAEFAAAGLVLAKGMGYWETLTELPARGKVFHLLKAKCRPVADSLGVALNSYIAHLR